MSIPYSIYEEKVITAAMRLLEKNIDPSEFALGMTSPELVTKYSCLKLENQERKVFSIIFLNSQLKIIKYEELFFGTIDEVEVHPRVIL